MATKFGMYSAIHESVTVARGQRWENTDWLKNQSHCRIRYRALVKNLKIVIHVSSKIQSSFFFFISLLQQLYKEEHIVKFKIPNL